MLRSFLYRALLGAFCPALVLAADVPDWSKVQAVKLFEVDHYCEGVVFDHDGNGYISHGKSSRSSRPTASTHVWAETGAPNGHKILADGTHLVCDASQHAVLHLGADGKMLGQAVEGVRRQAAARAQRPDARHAQRRLLLHRPGRLDDKKPIGTVHYVDAQGQDAPGRRGLAFPNGIVLHARRQDAVVGESKKNRVLVYDVKAPGKLGESKVFADLPEDSRPGQIDNQPDGMCLDAAGNLYVAHYGMQQVQVLSPEGKLIAPLPGRQRDHQQRRLRRPEHDQLFVTGGLGEGGGAAGCSGSTSASRA